MPRTKSFPAYFKADADDPTGTFEAIVAVFGNVDYQGDRIVDGAFTDTLERWKTLGDPIPVIHSHQWHDLDAHIGEVDPNNAEQLSAGDDRLPPELKDFGGLYVKGTLDIDEDPSAKKAHRLMSRRRIREFSFAYDILEDGEKRGDDGVNELTALDLIEVGPTLKGANPATALIDAKALTAALEAAGDVDVTDPAALAKAIADAVNPAPAAKARVTLGNSIEAHLAAIAGEVREWAGDTFGDDLYWVYVEATLPDHVLAYVELWDEPLEGGTFYEIAYTADDDDIELGDATQVTLELSTRPKAFDTLPRAKASHAPEPLTAKADDESSEGGGELDDTGPTSEDPTPSDLDPDDESLDAAGWRASIASELESV